MKKKLYLQKKEKKKEKETSRCRHKFILKLLSNLHDNSMDEVIDIFIFHKATRRKQQQVLLCCIYK